jgi:hypothetical protein
MTVARDSQTVIEILRINTDVKLRVSQEVVEIIRQNNAETPLIPSSAQPIIIITT